MPSAIFRHEGNSIDYTPGSAVVAGQVVVQGSLVGIAHAAIAADALGALAIEGVFEIEKESVAFTVGEDVFWDETNSLAFAGAGVYLGKAVKAVDAADDTVWVKLVLEEADASGSATGTGTGPG